MPSAAALDAAHLMRIYLTDAKRAPETSSPPAVPPAEQALSSSQRIQAAHEAITEASELLEHRQPRGGAEALYSMGMARAPGEDFTDWVAWAEGDACDDELREQQVALRLGSSPAAAVATLACATPAKSLGRTLSWSWVPNRTKPHRSQGLSEEIHELRVRAARVDAEVAALEGRPSSAPHECSEGELAIALQVALRLELKAVPALCLDPCVPLTSPLSPRPLA